MKYLIVIEKTNTGYSAYSPDLEGCVATGSTREEVEQAMREAIEFRSPHHKAIRLMLRLRHNHSHPTNRLNR
jgi:predicted RNase H-like HicB family nuclease